MPRTFALKINCLIYGNGKNPCIWSIWQVAIKPVAQWAHGDTCEVSIKALILGLGGNAHGLLYCTNMLHVGTLPLESLKMVN